MTAKEIKIQHNHTSDIVVIETERLQQENTNLKMQIDEVIKKYNSILKTCKTHPEVGDNELIGNVLEQVIDDLSKLKEVKK